jgi:hypothetical protein
MGGRINSIFVKIFEAGPVFPSAKIIIRSFKPFGNSTAVCPTSLCVRELIEYFVIMRDWTEIRLN